MRIQIASDLHLEFVDHFHPLPHAFRSVEDRDVLVLAGDIGVGSGAAGFVARELEVSPVVYVPGNHEYYHRAPRKTTDRYWRSLARSTTNLHYLVDAAAVIDGRRFWGTPWFSDLWGGGDPGTIHHVERAVNDFAPDRNRGEWSVKRHIETHRRQTRLIEREIGKVDVVVTHWPPTKDAIHPIYLGTPEEEALNPYFVNDRPDLVARVGAGAWISGHTHMAYDYWVGNGEGRTRCVGNPLGYPDEKGRSPLFRPDFVIEI